MAQCIECGVQTRFNGADRNFQCLGNFGEAEAINKAEQYCFAMFFRQSGKNKLEVARYGGSIFCGSGIDFSSSASVDW